MRRGVRLSQCMIVKNEEKILSGRFPGGKTLCTSKLW